MSSVVTHSPSLAGPHGFSGRPSGSAGSKAAYAVAVVAEGGVVGDITWADATAGFSAPANTAAAENVPTAVFFKLDTTLNLLPVAVGVDLNPTVSGCVANRRSLVFMQPLQWSVSN